MRIFARFIILLALAPLNALAQSQYPTRPVSMIVAAPPGGPGDSAARVVARALSDLLGQQVVTENRAASQVGAGAVARAAPDGYTLGTIGNQALTVTMAFGVDVPYKLEDFIPIGIVAFDITVITSRPDSPWKSIKDVTDYARQNPHKLSYGASGIGSMGQMAMEVVKLAFGAEITFIPYGGTAPTNTALLGGHIDLGSAGLGATMPFIKSGRLRALAVTSAERMPVLPDVPTVGEVAGRPSPNLWHGVFAPARTPAAIVDRLTKALEQAMKDPNTTARLEQAGLIADYRNPEATRGLMAAEIKVMAELARSVKLK